MNQGTTSTTFSHYPLFMKEMPYQDADDIQNALLLRVFCNSLSFSEAEDFLEKNTSEDLPLRKVPRACSFVDKMFPEIFSCALLGILLTMSCVKERSLVGDNKSFFSSHRNLSHEFSGPSLEGTS